MNVAAQMPLDWDDHAGWNTYYSVVRQTSEHLQYLSFDLMDAFRLVKGFDPARDDKFWFPGCGASIAPHLFKAQGFRIWASDVSEEAIAIQKTLKDMPIPVEQLEAIQARKQREGELHLFVHDFRKPLDIGDFEYLINVKALQALPPASMEAAAQVHYAALAPKGVAIFSTMNVQGERRDLIETILVNTGFRVPFYETNRWHRQVLAETGIEHVFILGHPRVLFGKYGEDKQRMEADQERLWSFTPEYRQRMEKERAEIQAVLDAGGDFKIANVIYNTG